MSLPLFILYGSATGNSQKISQDLAAEYEGKIPSPFTEIICCQGNDFKKKCAPIWEVEPTTAPGAKYGLVLVTATSGNGDAPENTSRFIRYLKRKTTPDTKPFRHVAFGVLALGDTNYDKFCETGKVADSCILKCGGTRAKALGCADEGTGLEDVVDPWIEDVVPILSKACSGTVNEESETKLDSTIQEEKKDDGVHAASQGFYGSRPNIPSMVGSRPNIPSMVGSRPNIPGMVGSRPNIPSMVGSRPNIPSMVGSRPNIPSMVGSRPNIPSMVGSRPNITNTVVPSVGSMPDVASIRARSAASQPSAATATTPKSVDVVGTTTLSSPTPLCILYGSATGNGEQIAKDLAAKYEEMLAKPGSCYFPKVICCELDKYKKECTKYWEDDSSLNKSLGQKHGVLIISSTTGNGEAPENASRFVRYIKRKTTVTTMPFRHVAFAVLGLGDTNYNEFCITAKIIDQKLHELGGSRAKDVDCADEGTGLEETVDPWVENIFDLLIKRCRGNESKLTKDLSEIESENVVPTSEKAVDTAKATTEPVIVSVVDTCVGVSTIRKLMVSLSSKESTAIPIVEDGSIPKVSSSLASYKIVDDEVTDQLPSVMPLAEMDRMTVSSASSSGIHYSIDCPFKSKVVSARYLTTTKTECAQVVSDHVHSTKLGDDRAENDKLIGALKHFQDAFPIESGKEEGSNDNIYAKNGKRVIEMTLSLPDDFTLEYKPGDSIGLVPSNTPEATNFVLNMLKTNHGILSTMKISVDSDDPTTLRQVIYDRLDLCSPIRNKRILAHLSHFASDDHEATALRLLASKDPLGENLFVKYIDEQHRSVVDILQDFPSCQSVSLDGLLAVIPSIVPRYYSICSSPMEKMVNGVPTLRVAFSVVDYMLPAIFSDSRKRRRGGLVTSHLEAICAPFLCQSASKNNVDELFTPDVRIFPKPSDDFHLPSETTKPLILIGPGTGIAPFMGFLAHRKAQVSPSDETLAAKVASEGTWRGDYTIDKNDLSVSTDDLIGLSLGSTFRNNQKVGEVDVYFGCRHSDHDWLFKNEMECLQKEGIISKLNVAFSREGEGMKRVYVQDKMKANADRLAHMIVDDDAVVYICGDGNKMAKDVESALMDILVKHKIKSSTDEITAVQLEVEKYVTKMKTDKRFLLDIWT